MTIDEAILHCKEKVKIHNEDASKWECTLNDYRQRSDGGHDETIKICRSSLNNCRKCAAEHQQLAEWLNELQKYRQIGTIEKCREAVEKQKPKNPKNDKLAWHTFCPNCKGELAGEDFCPNCGQAIQWGDEE